MESVKNKASIVPHVSISFTIDNILLFESNGEGINFSNASDLFNSYKVSTAFGMIILNIFIWFILAIYLD